MMGKLAVLTGFGAGYVLGARAGRERYEQIQGGARRLWRDPRVAQKRHEVADLAKEQATAAKDTVQEKVQEKVDEHRSSDSSASTPGTTA